MAGEGGSDPIAVPQKRRGRPRSGAAEAAILHAGAMLLAERGVRNMSMEAVAVTARVSKATIYRRWPSKDALILDLLSGAAGEGSEDAPPSGDARTDLVNWVRSGLEGERTTLGAAMLHIVRRAADDPALAANLRRRALGRQRERFAALVEQGLRAGQLRPDLDAALLLDLVSGPVLYHRLLDPEAPLADPAGQAQAIVDIVWPGIRANPATAG